MRRKAVLWIFGFANVIIYIFFNMLVSSKQRTHCIQVHSWDLHVENVLATLAFIYRVETLK